MKYPKKSLFVLLTFLCYFNGLHSLPTYSNQLHMLLGQISHFENETEHETKIEEMKFNYAIQHENEILANGFNAIPDFENEIDTSSHAPILDKNKTVTSVTDNQHVTTDNDGLPHVTTDNDVSQHVTTDNDVAQHVTTDNDVAQHVTTDNNVSQHATADNDVSQLVTTDNNVLQHSTTVNPAEEEPISGWFWLKHVADLFNLKPLLTSSVKKVYSFAECMSCRFAVGFFKHYINTGATEDDIGAFAYKVCTMFNIETPRVCAGVSKLFKRELTQVIMNVALSPSEVCGFLFRGCGTAVNPLHDWSVPLTPFPKPPSVPPEAPKKGSPTLRVLHISDVHIDPYYAEGSDASCGEPLCCREASGKPAIPADAAGYWGDYRNCDIPLRTLENMLEHINKTHKLDYVIWTGDIPPHDIWNNSRTEAIDLLHVACKVIQKHLGNIPIFPALGNHESSPVNGFPIPEIKGNDSISWLYEEVAKAWSGWLPNSIDTLKLGAYYSVPVYPGFRIISLNMNYCNSLNWWLLLNSTDPTGQLAWLVAQLQMAEDKNEKVHIIGHIPPGEPDCLGVWSSNYHRIVNRYENTITGQFFGHTHNDEFEVFYDRSGPEPRATNVAYIGPSVTTFDGVNPGYRIYTMDGSYPKSSFAILDSETYITNLTQANLSPAPTWQFEYSAKKDYNMSSLLPQEWDNLIKRLEKDDQLFMKFNGYFYKLSDAASPNCDADCKKRMLCRLRRAQSNDPLFCV